ncbi:flippase [Marinobacter sp.]|uniref:flippase n=1 Tax=Marinobacter sp. TaxID=50741 RepID=UPI000C56B71E|nr:flippase [Marinobacter sp.]MAO13063.1 O-unit flippase [Marinobacter sp.]
MRGSLAKLKAHAGFRKYAANTSWLVAEKILRLFVGLFVTIWVARYLGPSDFGLLSYAQSFALLFTALASLGLDSIVVRELVKDSSRQGALLGTAFVLKAVAGVLVLPLIYAGLQMTSNASGTNLLVIVVALSIFFQSFNVIDFYFQAKVLSKYVAFANSLTLMASSVIKLSLIVSGASVIAFAWMVVFDAVVLAIGLVWFYWRRKGPAVERWQFDASLARQLLKDSWPLVLSGMVISVYMKIDQIMIKEMLGESAVGYYAAAVRLSEAWYFIPMVLATSLFPALLNARQRGPQLYLNRLQHLYTLMVWLAIAIAIPVSFVGPWVIEFLYGVEFAPAGVVLVVHIWAAVFVFLGVAYGKYLAAENYTRKALYRTGLGALINVALNWLLIPLWGIVGAAVALLAAQFMSNYLYDVFDPDVRHQLRLKNRALVPLFLLKRNPAETT